MVTDLIDEIVAKIFSISFSHLLFGGDINYSPIHKCGMWAVVCAKLSLVGVHHVAHLLDTYTCIQESTGAKSCIDHFFTNCNAMNGMAVEFVDTVDSYMNFSDHIPVSLTLVSDISKLYAKHVTSACYFLRPI